MMKTENLSWTQFFCLQKEKNFFFLPSEFQIAFTHFLTLYEMIADSEFIGMHTLIMHRILTYFAYLHVFV